MKATLALLAPADAPDVVKARGDRLLLIGAGLTAFTTLALWVGNPFLFLLSVPASIAALVLLLKGWGVRHGALWALKWVPADAREREDVKAFFHGDEACPGCAAAHPPDAAFCAHCGHAFHAPPSGYWADVKFAFERLVKKQPVEPPRTAAFAKRAPHETTDKLLVLAVAFIVGGWIASNTLASFAYVFVVIGTTVPAALLLMWLRKQDRFEPEPWTLMLIAFGWGMLSGVFVMPANTILIQATGLYQWAGITEELAKAAIVVFIATHRTFRKEFNGPVDGIVYAGAAGLGFAAMENFGYVLTIASGGASVLEGLAFRSTGLISHMMYAGIAGGYLGLMQLRKGRVAPRDLLVAFVPAAVPHALNNTGALGVFTLLGLPTLIAAWWFFKGLADALRDEAAWGYATGQAPVEEKESVKEAPPAA